MADIKVTLTNEQVVAAKEYANKTMPDATNLELLDILQEAAYAGPGIRAIIGQWELEALKIDTNAARAAAVVEFDAVFPPAYEG